MSALVIRYCVMFDDRTEDIQDKVRMAEFIFSLVSVKHYLLPFIECEFYIYCSRLNQDRVSFVMSYLDIKPVQFLVMDDEQDIEFAGSIRYCTSVDRICIRRMLFDFRSLPQDRFRLLIGTDIYFFKIPDEIICRNYGNDGKYDVPYLADTTTFRGELYRLRFWHGSLLPGLLGDFYLLPPRLQIDRSAIISALRIIDSWSPLKRYLPELPKGLRNNVHSCEQQATSIVLGQWQGYALPPDRYMHYLPKPTMAVLHGKRPWVMPKKVPDALFKDFESICKDFQYTHIIDQIDFAKRHEQKLHRKLKHFLWQTTGYRGFI